MKLCWGFSLLLKRLEIDLNESFDDIFLDSWFWVFFRELYIRKFREFCSDDFYEKNRSYDKKIDFFYEREAGTRNLE